MIENVIDLPAELNFTLATLTQGNILEKRDVIVKDRGLANQISLQATDASRSTGLNEASRIDGICQSGRVFKTSLLIWIANQVRAGGYVTTSKISNCRGRACGRRSWRQDETRGAAFA